MMAKQRITTIDRQFNIGKLLLQKYYFLAEVIRMAGTSLMVISARQGKKDGEKNFRKKWT